MQYLRGWRALRQDPRWTAKILIGSVLLLVPLVGPIVLSGWRALMLRRAVSGQDAPLPRLDFDMEYLKQLLMTGFKGFVVQLLWSLPLVVVFLGGCLGCAISAFVAGAGAIAGDALGGLAVLCAGLAFGVIALVLLILVSMPFQIAVLRAELTDDLDSAMRFKDVFAMTRVMAKELIVGQVVLGLLTVLVFLPFAVFTVGLGVYPANVVRQIVSVYWLAQIYERYREKGGEPLALGPLDVSQPAQQSAPPPF